MGICPHCGNKANSGYSTCPSCKQHITWLTKKELAANNLQARNTWIAIVILLVGFGIWVAWYKPY